MAFETRDLWTTACHEDRRTSFTPLGRTAPRPPGGYRGRRLLEPFPDGFGGRQSFGFRPDPPRLGRDADRPAGNAACDEPSGSGRDRPSGGSSGPSRPDRRRSTEPPPVSQQAAGNSPQTGRPAPTGSPTD